MKTCIDSEDLQDEKVYITGNQSSEDIDDEEMSETIQIQWTFSYCESKDPIRTYYDPLLSFFPFPLFLLPIFDSHDQNPHSSIR